MMSWWRHWCPFLGRLKHGKENECLHVYLRQGGKIKFIDSNFLNRHWKIRWRHPVQGLETHKSHLQDAFLLIGLEKNIPKQNGLNKTHRRLSEQHRNYKTSSKSHFHTPNCNELISMDHNSRRASMKGRLTSGRHVGDQSCAISEVCADQGPLACLRRPIKAGVFVHASPGGARTPCAAQFNKVLAPLIPQSFHSEVTYGQRAEGPFPNICAAFTRLNDEPLLVWFSTQPAGSCLTCAQTSVLIVIGLRVTLLSTWTVTFYISSMFHFL